MYYWSQVPLSRLLLPFVVGIIASIFISHEINNLLYVIIVLLLFLFIAAFLKQFYSVYKYRWIFGAVLNTLLFVFGYYLVTLKTERFNEWHFSHFEQNKDNIIIAKVTEPLVKKNNSFKTILEVKAIKKNQWEKVTGKIIAYFQKDSANALIRYGDVLLLSVQWNEVQPPRNPSEFNYKRYLSFHQIEHQAFIKKGKWIVLQQGQGNKLLDYSFKAREKLLFLFKENNVQNQEFAVASALILGYKEELDTDMIRAYSSTGAMHVLAVSGLHVGIIYIVLNGLLLFLEKIRHGIILKAMILIISLWVYALLTGLSPSVMRAATMLSFVVVGKATNKNTNIYNTLTVSAFLLLLINPYLIMEVGFQLSYLAVLGIVFVQPKIYRLWETDNWLLDKIWMITTVSIAAQIATFPLGLLYFHQFPNYFLFSNLIVIPLATFVIYAGIILFITSFIPVVASWSALILKYLVLSLNASVQFIEHLPFAMLQGISISITETWIIYLFIGCFLAYFSLVKIKYMYYAFSFLILLLCFQLYETYFQSVQKKMIVYSINQQSAYDFIYGRQNIFIADSALIRNDDRMLFHIKHNWWNLGLAKNHYLNVNTFNLIKEMSLMQKDNFIQFHDKKIAVIDNKRFMLSDKKINVDFIILSKNSCQNISTIQKQFNFKQIIVDSSNSIKKTEQWLKEAKQLNVNIYSVNKQGAFILDA